MSAIEIHINRDEVYDEVAKATDYTGSKLEGGDDVRDRVLAGDEDLADLGRFWDESVLAVNEQLKEMLTSGASDAERYTGKLEVSVAFDTALTGSVENAVRSFFINHIIAQWFKFANKEEAQSYFDTAAEFLMAAERLLYSRMRPQKPKKLYFRE